MPRLRALLTWLHKAGRIEGVATIHPDGRIDLMIHQNPKRSYRRKQKPTAAPTTAVPTKA